MKKVLLLLGVLLFGSYVFSESHEWILQKSLTDGVSKIQEYVDFKSIKDIDGYKLYWVKYDTNTGSTIVRQALNCKTHEQLLMGGMKYSNFSQQPVEKMKYNEKNFKNATEWKPINMANSAYEIEA